MSILFSEVYIIHVHVHVFHAYVQLLHTFSNLRCISSTESTDSTLLSFGLVERNEDTEVVSWFTCKCSLFTTGSIPPLSTDWTSPCGKSWPVSFDLTSPSFSKTSYKNNNRWLKYIQVNGKKTNINYWFHAKENPTQIVMQNICAPGW